MVVFIILGIPHKMGEDILPVSIPSCLLGNSNYLK